MARERFATDEVRGVMVHAGVAEQERTARRSLVAPSSCRIEFHHLEFSRRERAHRGDVVLRGNGKMNSVVANGQRIGRVARRTVLCRDDATLESRKSGLVDCVVGMAPCHKRRHRWSNMNVQGRMIGQAIGQVTGTGDRGGMRLVRKSLTFGGQATCGRTEAIESSNSLPDRFAFDRNTTRGRRRILSRDFTAVGMMVAGSRIFVQRRECGRTRNAGAFADVAKLRQWVTNDCTRRVFAELLGVLLVDTATAACALRCRRWRGGCPMATRMPMYK
jgi:hypothetical protein